MKAEEKNRISRGDAEKAEGENSKDSTVSSPISPPRSPHLRVNKTPGGAQSYGRKRFRLGNSDDQDSLFRISRWVTPANRNESGGKKPNLTRRRGEGRGENSKESTISSPISPPRSPRLRVNKTPGGAQSYGMKRVRLAKSDDQDYLFRIGWVTRQSQSKRRKKTEPHAETWRRGEGRGEKQEGIHRIVTNLPPSRSPHLRVNKTPGGAQFWGGKGSG